VQGRLQQGEWVAVHGCGGVGLSAIMIAVSAGAKPIAIDIREDALHLARALGAVHTVLASEGVSVSEKIIELTQGGADVSMDALGSRESCRNSILCLRKQGRHIQVGLLLGKEADPPVPLSAVIARELEIIGSHGMQAREYPAILKQMEEGTLQPEKMLGKILTLEEGAKELMQMGSFPTTGVSLIRFPD
jgi:alcohol dehydrogenase